MLSRSLLIDPYRDTPKLPTTVVSALPQAGTGGGSLYGISPGAILLKRYFEIDLEPCPTCGEQLEIAAILESPMIERILMHLGLQPQAPPQAPARGHMQHAA